MGALPYLKIDGMLEYIAELVFLQWLEGLARKSLYVLESLRVTLLRLELKWQA